MKALWYRLRLLEPLLVGKIGGGEENSEIGMNYLPGSMVRGALVAAYLRTEENPDNLAVADRERALFLDSTVCYLNAYPYNDTFDKGYARMLPRPRSWFTEKAQVADEDESADLYDMAIDADTPLEQAKPPKNADFCVIGEVEPGEATLYAPNRQINLHISLDQPNTRSGNNTMYRYDAIAAGGDRSHLGTTSAGSGKSGTWLCSCK